jgi:hypothetical protein
MELIKDYSGSAKKHFQGVEFLTRVITHPSTRRAIRDFQLKNIPLLLSTVNSQQSTVNDLKRNNLFFGVP